MTIVAQRAGNSYIDRAKSRANRAYWCIPLKQDDSSKSILKGINFSIQEIAIVDWQFATIEPQVE